ncbi:zinc finger, CCHC-type containing protein [Tanacetum coccineum]|uniref:Zinc finger, CCHC-type containing protein n=1 Tax=Tanacetum coccineum TaxID=301880 RepID=A0ABQ4XNS5_9ASTR
MVDTNREEDDGVVCKVAAGNTNEPKHVKPATKVGDDHLGITSMDKEGEVSVKNGVPGTPNTDLHDATVAVDETLTRFGVLYLVSTMNPSRVIEINVENYELLLLGFSSCLEFQIFECDVVMCGICCYKIIRFEVVLVLQFLSVYENFVALVMDIIVLMVDSITFGHEMVNILVSGEEYDKILDEFLNDLHTKYMAEDASSKKFLVSNFTNYKMTDSRPVLEQYNELLGILGRFTQHKMNMDEAIQDELTLVELGNHLRIKESLRVQDSDKPKGNNVDGPSVVNMVEHNNSSGDCKGVNVGNKANGSGTKDSVDGSSNSLKGATIHVCKDRCWFKTYESLNDGSIIHMGNESTALVHGSGCVDLRFSSRKIVLLFNVLHVPNIRKNFVSSSILNNYGYKQVIESNKFVLSKHGVFIDFGYLSNQMLRLNIFNDNIASAFMSTSKLNDSILWHARLSHVHFKRMQDMFKDGLISAFDMDIEKCNTCMLTKITKKPFQNIKHKTKVLELIYNYLCDLHATPSLGNKKYFVTFIDDASRFYYVYLLNANDEALDKFKVFKIEVELQQESLIKRFRTDRGVSSVVTYTSVYSDSEPWRFQWVSDDELEAPEEPLPVDASPTALPPSYVADSDPSEEDLEEDPADGGDDDNDDDDDDDDDDDEDDEEDEEEEENLAPADSTTLPSIDLVPSAKDTEAFKTDESAPTPTYTSPTYTEAPLGYKAAMIRSRVASPSPVPSPRLRRARIYVRSQTPMAVATKALIAAVATALPSSSPPPSPLTPLSSPLPQIPSPPLPLPLPSPLLPLPTPSSPLLLPTTDHREDVPEADPGLDVTPVTDYSFVDIVDATPGRPMSREVGYEITDVWDNMVGDMEGRTPTTFEELSQRVTDLSATLARDTHEMYVQFEGTQDDRALQRARVNTLFRDRRYHLHITMLLKSEARYARQAWSQAIDCNRAVHAEILAYRAEVRALHEQISVLQRQQTKDQRARGR